MFCCYINVKVCASIKVIKYMAKYMYKGYDRTTLKVKNRNNKIKTYRAGCYLKLIKCFAYLIGYLSY
jgi:hypothetical protein